MSVSVLDRDLVLDRDAVNRTWACVTARIERRPVFEVVPEEAMETIETIVAINEDKAWENWPTNTAEDKAHRIQFWKQRVLRAVVDFAASAGEDPNVGLWAVYFHEYVAANMRGAEAAMSDDIRYTRASVSPDIARRALHDAYATCAAGLDGYRVEWNE